MPNNKNEAFLVPARLLFLKLFTIQEEKSPQKACAKHFV